MSICTHEIVTIRSYLDFLIESIPIYTLHSFYNYKLDLGVILLRSMCQLRLRKNPSFRHSIEFLLWQQRPDGRIGFLNLGTTNINTKESLNQYIPLTTSAMWTIAEAINPSFSLFSSI